MIKTYPDLLKFKAVKDCLQQIEVQKNPEPQLESLVQLACLLEATAFKPGNVHPAASFHDCCYDEFVTSASLIAPVLTEANKNGVGQTILNAVQLTHHKVQKNTNLGIIMLMAPICAVPENKTLSEGVPEILNDLTVDDSRLLYEAIQITNAGGLGKVTEQDIQQKPDRPLPEIMKLAADHDRIASEYSTGYKIILNRGIEILKQSVQLYEDWHEVILNLHLTLMSEFPDTLISRKCGKNVAEQSGRMAREVLEARWPETDSGKLKLTRLDHWLRADGHRRNPGTTADFVAAILLAGFRDKLIPVPKRTSI